MGPVELLYSTIGIFHESAGPPEFSIEVVRTIIRPPLGVHPNIDGIRIISNRDQLEVLLSQERTEVRDSSGNVGDGSSKMVEVLLKMMELRELVTIRSYDINFVSECDNVSGEVIEGWLGQHFLNQALADTFGATPLCNSLVISYSQGTKTNLMELTAVPNTRAAIHFVVHEEAEALPEIELLQSELQSQYAYYTGLLRKVGFE